MEVLGPCARDFRAAWVRLIENWAEPSTGQLGFFRVVAKLFHTCPFVTSRKLVYVTLGRSGRGLLPLVHGLGMFPHVSHQWLLSDYEA